MKSDLPFRSPYVNPPDRSSDLGKFSPSKTKQSFVEESDINTLMKRYETTGVLPDAIKAEPRYGDFSSPVDYRDSLDIVRFAQEQFAGLPAAVRARFGNDPEAFLEFTSRVENTEEMAKLGLLKPEAVARLQAEKTAKESPPAPKAEGEAKKGEGTES